MKIPPPPKLPFRRPQSPAGLEAAVVEWLQLLEARLAAAYAQGNLIGQPFPVISGLDLGEKFAPCDGRVLKNKASPLHGRTLPIITSQLGSLGVTTIEWYVRIVD